MGHCSVFGTHMALSWPFNRVQRVLSGRENTKASSLLSAKQVCSSSVQGTWSSEWIDLNRNSWSSQKILSWSEMYTCHGRSLRPMVECIPISCIRTQSELIGSFSIHSSNQVTFWSLVSVYKFVITKLWEKLWCWKSFDASAAPFQTKPLATWFNRFVCVSISVSTQILSGKLR